MVDILLVQPPIRDFYLTAKRTVPYGLAAIAATLSEGGYTVEILDALATGKSRPLPTPPEMAYLQPFYGRPDMSPFGLFHQYRHYGYAYQHVRKMAAASGAFLVGISSLFTPYTDEALETADIIRAALPGCRIVLGGHHPTALPTAVMASPSVDYVIRGEGEAAMPALAKALKTGADLRHVPGIVFRKTDGTLHVSEPAVMATPDHYPLPARHLIKEKYYRRGKKGTTVVVTSRGCPLKCTYCALGNEHYPYRRRSLSAVLAEIEDAVARHGARFIDFEDENISLNRGWFLSLLRAVSDRFAKYKLELRAMNGLYPPTLNDEVAAAMAQAGFTSLNLSLGSASPDQLKRFGRPDVRPAFDTALDLAEKYAMDAVGYIIVGAPGQTPQDSVSDLSYLAARRVLAGVSVYYPAPASADYETCRRLGVLPGNFSLMRASALPVEHTTTRLETVTLMRLGRMVNFMKHIRDAGGAMPSPEVFDPMASMRVDDRNTIGEQLLSWFLHDGVIRGVSHRGRIYEHVTSAPTTDRFLKQLGNLPVRGVMN